MHYLIANALDLNGYEDFAIDVSNYNDISKLYLISDCLITDYSSVMFDYGILKRPQFFFAYDIEKYDKIYVVSTLITIKIYQVQFIQSRGIN